MGLVLRDVDVAFQENVFTLENGQNLVAFLCNGEHAVGFGGGHCERLLHDNWKG